MDSGKLGSKIRKLRKAKKLTQDKLGELIPISGNMISKWERGYSIPDIGTIKRLADIFEVDISSLVGDATSINLKYKLKTTIKSILIFLKNNILKIINSIAFVLLLIFYFNNRNIVQIYKIKKTSNNIYFEKSYFIKNDDKIFLLIDDIKLLHLNHEVKSLKMILYTLFNGEEYILYISNDLNKIIIDDLSKKGDQILNKDIIAAIKKNLYLKIITQDKNNKEHIYEVKLDLIKSFSNNKLIYKTPKINLNIDMNNDYGFLEETNLINKGFKKVENRFIYEKKEINQKVQLDMETNIFRIIKEDQNITIKYNYYYNNELYEVFKYKKGKLLLKFKYRDNKLYCFHGNCSNYQKYNDYVKNEFFKLSK